MDDTVTFLRTSTTGRVMLEGADEATAVVVKLRMRPADKLSQ